MIAAEDGCVYVVSDMKTVSGGFAHAKGIGLPNQQWAGDVQLSDVTLIIVLIVFHYGFAVEELNELLDSLTSLKLL
jgi:hypothetical protein